MMDEIDMAEKEEFKRPCFSDLTPEEQMAFGNGVGPRWFPDWLSYIVTHWASWFFQDASWRHHDFGYHMGYTERHRKHYDRLFLEAMLRDAREQNEGWFCYLRMVIAIGLSYVFWAAVRLFGAYAFHYGEAYDMSVLDVAKNYKNTA